VLSRHTSPTPARSSASPLTSATGVVGASRVLRARVCASPPRVTGAVRNGSCAAQLPVPAVRSRCRGHLAEHRGDGPRGHAGEPRVLRLSSRLCAVAVRRRCRAGVALCAPADRERRPAGVPGLPAAHGEHDLRPPPHLCTPAARHTRARVVMLLCQCVVAPPSFPSRRVGHVPPSRRHRCVHALRCVLCVYLPVHCR
jgi:hypothetical protein